MATVGIMAYPIRDSYSSYPPQYSMYQNRTHQPQPDTSAPSIHVNSYGNYSSATSAHQHFQPPPSRTPQLLRHESTGSNVSEDGNRPSLPSISNLLGIADGDRDHATKQAQQQAQVAHQQSQALARDQRQRAMYPPHELLTSQRPAIPPESSLRNDSIVDRAHSPSTISTGSSLSAQPYFMGSALNNMEADQQRVAQANFMKRHSIPPHPNTSPYGASPYTTSPYTSSPGALSSGSFYSPSDPLYQVPNSIYQQQRPLPSNFPPQLAPMQVQSTPNLPTGNPWEHHHYISPSSQATFPQSQDRYICQTCSKAFSRPSSLKIHSHSHTGEKPFKCPHTACGKAFSVRSNMKRHERGCHTGAGGMAHLG